MPAAPLGLDVIEIEHPFRIRGARLLAALEELTPGAWRVTITVDTGTARISISTSGLSATDTCSARNHAAAKLASFAEYAASCAIVTEGSELHAN